MDAMRFSNDDPSLSYTKVPGQQDIISPADEPLVIEELETPRDRFSVVNGAVHYLAGSESARYPLPYQRFDTDDKYFNCLEYAESTECGLQEREKKGPLTSEYCSSDSEQDIEYLKEICRKSSHRKGQETQCVEGVRTPTRKLRARIERAYGMDETPGANIVQVEEDALNKTFSEQLQFQQRVPNTVSSASVGNRDPYLSHSKASASMLRSHESGYKSVDSHNAQYHAQNVNRFSGNMSQIKAREDVREREDVSRLNKNTSAPINFSGRRHNQPSGRMVTKDCKSLLSFAREFRERYGGVSYDDPLDTERSSTFAKEERFYPNLDEIKAVSWESTTASSDYIPDNYNSYNRDILGTYLSARESGIRKQFDTSPHDHHKAYSKGLHHGYQSKESSAVARGSSMSGIYVGKHNSDDILLRDYGTLAKGEQPPTNGSIKEVDVNQIQQERDAFPSKSSLATELVHNAARIVRSPPKSDEMQKSSTNRLQNNGLSHIYTTMSPSGVREGIKSSFTQPKVLNNSDIKEGTSENKHEEYNGYRQQSYYDVKPHVTPVSLSVVNKQIDDFFNSVASPAGRFPGYVAPATNREIPMPYHRQNISSQALISKLGSHGTSTQVPSVLNSQVNGNSSTSCRMSNTSAQQRGQDYSEKKVDVAVQTLESDVAHVGVVGSQHGTYSDAKVTATMLLPEEKEWEFELAKHMQDLPTPGMKISFIDDVLNGTSDDVYNLSCMDTRKSGDVNLYDSARLDEPPLPIHEERVDKGVTNDKMVQFNGLESKTMVRLDTAHEESPGTKAYESNGSTKTSHIICDSNIEFPSQHTILSFGDDISSYVPGKSMPGKSDPFADSDIFASDVISKTDVYGKVKNLDSICSYANKPDLTCNSGTHVESSEAAYTHCVDHAPRNLSHRDLRGPDGQFRRISSNRNLNTSEDISENPTINDDRAVGCKHCTREFVTVPSRTSDRCSFRDRSNSSMDKVRNCNSSNKMGETFRKLYEAPKCRSISSQFPSTTEGVILPVSSLRSTKPGIFNRTRRATYSTDLFSDVSSDYVKLPSDDASCVNGECKECDFSGGEDASDQSCHGTKNRIDKSLLNPIEDMLAEQLNNTKDFDGFVTLVKRLYAALEDKNLLGSDGKAQMKSVNCNDALSTVNSDSISATAHVTTGSTEESSELGRARKNIFASRGRGDHHDPIPGTDSVPLSSYMCAGKGSSLFGGGLHSSRMDKPMAGFNNSTWLKQAIAEVRQSKVVNGSLMKEDDGSHRPVVSEPLTKETLISRLASDSGYLNNATLGSGSNDIGDKTEYVKPGFGTKKASSELPDGLTQEQLMDVYSEVMKLTRIFHVKDVKSLTRAVTARVNERTM